MTSPIWLQISSTLISYFLFSPTEKLRPICITAKIDPETYRPNPALARTSREFLIKIESEMAIGIRDSILLAYKRRNGNYSRPKLYFRMISDQVAMEYPNSQDCGKNGVSIIVKTKYDNVKKSRWLLSTEMKVNNTSVERFLNGVDAYGECDQSCIQDPYGGISTAIIKEGGNILDFIERNLQ